jgi:hypothetical protein
MKQIFVTEYKTAGLSTSIGVLTLQ